MRTGWIALFLLNLGHATQVAALTHAKIDTEIAAFEGGGTSGYYLAEIGGSMIFGSNESLEFEPASVLKTLHLYAVSQAIQDRWLQPAHPLLVHRAQDDSTCPKEENPLPSTVEQSAFRMMRESDNDDTVALEKIFGRDLINDLARNQGLTGTELRHVIGCPEDAKTRSNHTTLRDLARIHEVVLDPSFSSVGRDFFYSMMRNAPEIEPFWKPDQALPVMVERVAKASVLTPKNTQKLRTETQFFYKTGHYTIGGAYSYALAGVLMVPTPEGRLRQFFVGAFLIQSRESVMVPHIARIAVPLIEEALATSFIPWK